MNKYAGAIQQLDDAFEGMQDVKEAIILVVWFIGYKLGWVSLESKPGDEND